MPYTFRFLPFAQFALLSCLLFSGVSYSASPVINNVPELTATVGVPYIFDLGATDADGGELRYSIYSWPSGLDVKISQNGVVSWSSDEHNDAGNYAIVATVYDSENNKDEVRYKLIITDPNNHEPVINNSPILEATVGVPYSYDLGATDDDGDNLRYTIYSWPFGQDIRISQNGVITLNSNEHNDAGTYAVVAQVYDDNNGSDIVRYKLTITDPNNHPPVINNPPILEAVVGSDYHYDLGATDEDSDTLKYSIYSWPSGQDIRISQDGVISWSPDDNSEIRDYAVIVTVDDNNNGSEQIRYKLTLSPAQSNDDNANDSDGDGITNDVDPFPTDPENNKNAYWKHCSNEFGRCTVPIPSTVRYGLNGVYAYQKVIGTIDCRNSVFGNPIDERKVCEYLLSDTEDFDGDGVVDSLDAFPEDALESVDTDGDRVGDNSDPYPENDQNIGAEGQWIYCVRERETCEVPVRSTVRYGANGTYAFRTINGSVECSNGVFGDPIGGVVKHCEYLLSETADFDQDNLIDNIDPFPSDPKNNLTGHWQQCATQDEACQISNESLVRYGAQDNYHFQITSDNIICNAASFNGVSIAGVSKHCDYLSFAPVITNDKKEGWIEIGGEGASIGLGLLTSIKIDNNNIPYIAYRDTENAYKVTVKRLNGPAWEIVGAQGLSSETNVSVDPVYAISMSIDNNNVPYIAYNDFGATSKIVVKRFNGTAWETMGTEGFSQGVVKDISVHFDSNNIPYVTYIDGGYEWKVVVKQFNGTGWKIVGAEVVSQEKVQSPLISFDDNNVLQLMYANALYNYNASTHITVKRFNGTSWETLSEDFFTDFSDSPTLVMDNNNTPYVFYRDLHNASRAAVKRYNGSTWESVGEAGFSQASIENLEMHFDNSTPYVAYTNFPRTATIKRFNGAAWEDVGKQDVSKYDVSHLAISMDSNNVPYVIYNETFNQQKLTVKRFYDGSIYHGVLDNKTAAIDINATDISDNTLVYSLMDSYDASLFTMNPDNGMVTFNAPPDFENPLDNNADNIYVFEVRVVNEKGYDTIQKVTLLILKSDRPVVTTIPTVTASDVVTIEVNGQPGHQVWINGINTGKVLSSNGVINIELDAHGEDGDKHFMITLRDSVGNESESFSFTVVKDTVTLENPIVTNIPSTTDADTITVLVSGKVGSRVFVNGEDSGQVIGDSGYIIGASGYVNVALDTRGGNGDQHFTIVLKDGEGHKSSGISFTVTKDTAVSDAPTVTVHFPATDKDTNIVTVNGEAGHQIVVNGHASGQYTNSIGSASVILDTSGEDGDKDFTIALRDSAGNESEGFSFTIVKDTIAPATPIVTNIPSTTDANTTIVSVSGEAGSRVSGTAVKPDQFIGESGSAEIALDTSGYNAEKSYRISLYDQAGNYSDAAPFSIRKDAEDSAGPTLTTFPLNTNSDTTIVEVNGKVGSRVFVNGKDSGQVIGASGRVEVTLDTRGDDGYQRFTIVLKDSEGNESGGITFTITKDTAVPDAPTVTVHFPTTDKDTNIVTVNGEAGHQIVVNGHASGQYTNSIGSASVTLDTSGEDGDKHFTIALRDVAGNESEAINIIILKDTIVPDTPTLTTIPISTIQNTTQVEVNGEIGSQVWVNGVDSGKLIASSGKISVALDTSGEAGDKAFSITLKNNAGNTSKALLLTVNKQFVPAPVITNSKKQGWFDVGSEISAIVPEASYAISMAISSSNIPYIAYADGLKSNKITVKRFNGTLWETVGVGGFSSGRVLTTSIDIDRNNVPYVAYNNFGGSGNTVVKQFNGTAWETVGIEGIFLVLGNSISVNIDNNDVPYVTYVDTENSKRVAVKKFNGSAWENVGIESPSLSESGSPALFFTNNNIPYIIYRDVVLNNSLVLSKIIVKKFDGSTWQPLGEEAFSENNVFESVMRLDANNVPYIFYKDGSNGSVKRFNGTAWEFVGQENFTIDRVSSFSMSIDNNNTPYVLYHDFNKAFVQRFNGEFWEFVGEDASSEDIAVAYSGNHKLNIDNNNAPYIAYPETGESTKVVVRRFYNGSINTNVFEGNTTAIDIDATDINSNTLHYSLVDYDDASLFSINENSGLVTFNTTPNTENPQDNNQDNIYTFEVRVENELGSITVQKVNVTIVRDDRLTPVVSASKLGGSYTHKLNVELTSNHSNVIYYTIDGSIPDENSLVYSQQIEISETTTLNYFSEGNGNYKASTIQTEQYTLDLSAPKVLTGYPASGQVLGVNDDFSYTFSSVNTLSSITIKDNLGQDLSPYTRVEGNTLYVDFDSNQHRLYDVTITATDSAGNVSSIPLEFLVDTIAPTTAVNISTGEFSQAISLDLLSNDIAAKIYYSTDGFPPIIGADNTQEAEASIKGITIDKTTKLQFFAVDTAGNREPINTEIYYFGDLLENEENVSVNYQAPQQQVTLSWENDPSASHYNIYRADNIIDQQILLDSINADYLAPKKYRLAASVNTNYSDTDVSHGARYYYAVSKVINSVETRLSNIVEVDINNATTIQTQQESILRAINYLKKSQNPDGSWSNTAGKFSLLHTSQALDALKGHIDNPYTQYKALYYLAGHSADNNDFLARKIITLSSYGIHSDSLINKLLSKGEYQQDGNAISWAGWGAYSGFHYTAYETALALKAIAQIKTSQRAPLFNQLSRHGLSSLNERSQWQWQNGSLFSTQPSVYISALAHSLTQNTDINQWLTQNSDGSYGEGSLDTAAVLLYIDVDATEKTQAIDYLISQQHSDGSFGNVSLTAICLEALSQETL